MLTTPVQPHNSLNTIVPNKHPDLNHKDYTKVLGIEQPLNTQTYSRKSLKPKNVHSQTLARRKVFLELKLQETMRKNADQKLQSIEEHKGDLIQRKQMLAVILNEYEQLSKDKNLLTAEIKNMKKYLADICTKLDQSLTALNKNTTIFAMKRGLANLASKSTSLTKVKRLKKKRNSTKHKDSTMKSVLSALNSR